MWFQFCVSQKMRRPPAVPILPKVSGLCQPLQLPNLAFRCKVQIPHTNPESRSCVCYPRGIVPCSPAGNYPLRARSAATVQWWGEAMGRIWGPTKEEQRQSWGSRLRERGTDLMMSHLCCTRHCVKTHTVTSADDVFAHVFQEIALS